jgi:tetratricopeptide (TPR) repeat protein
VIVFIIPLFLLAVNYRDCDMSDNYILHDLPLNVLSTLPKDSVFYTVNDSTRFGIWYMQGVHGIRTDVIAVWPFQPPWYEKQFSSKHQNVPRLPYYIQPHQFGERDYYTDMMSGPFSSISKHLSPEGLIYKVGLKPVRSIESARKGKVNLIDRYRYRGIYNVDAHRDRFTKEVMIWYGEANNNVGAVFQNRGDFKNAVEMYERAITIMPADFVAYFNSALIFRAQGDYMKAARLFKTAIKNDPAFVESYKQLAILYANNLNDPREAVRYFKEYLSFDPKDKDVPIIKEYVRANKDRMQ